jgi:hypothetical protein
MTCRRGFGNELKKRCFTRVLLCIAAAALMSVWPFAHAVVASCEGFRVVSPELAPAGAEAYCRYAVQERAKVQAFWGATWTELIEIRVSSGIPFARSLVVNGGRPGVIEMPLARVKDHRGALLHEVVHNYAVSPHNNRFLQEGIAVYLQDKLGGNPAFPNHGKGLHVLAREHLPAGPTLGLLNNVVFPRPLAHVMPQLTAYILAGSFTRFLIDKYGLAQFRKLYESNDYEAVYGKRLEALEQEWRACLPECG